MSSSSSVTTIDKKPYTPEGEDDEVAFGEGMEAAVPEKNDALMFMVKVVGLIVFVVGSSITVAYYYKQKTNAPKVSSTQFKRVKPSELVTLPAKQVTQNAAVDTNHGTEAVTITPETTTEIAGSFKLPSFTNKNQSTATSEVTASAKNKFLAQSMQVPINAKELVGVVKELKLALDQLHTENQKLLEQVGLLETLNIRSDKNIGQLALAIEAISKHKNQGLSIAAPQIPMQQNETVKQLTPQHEQLVYKGHADTRVWIGNPQVDLDLRLVKIGDVIPGYGTFERLIQDDEGLMRLITSDGYILEKVGR